MNFWQFLQTKDLILFDGAMGTQLDKRGLEMGGGNNLTHPEAVLEIHKEYAEAGCDVLIANTLTMNRIYIETHNLPIDVEAVNRAGVRLAKEAADGKCFVVGDISSTGQLMEPLGSYTEEEFFQNFREQAGILAANGVDGFIIETVFDLREALCALRACKEAAPELPVVVSLSFATTAKGGRTIMGNSAEEFAKAAAENGAAAVGANCGDLTPVEMAELVATMKNATSIPIIVQPNAGKPVLQDGVTSFDMTPEAFAEGVLECIKAGARIVGGCCGTSPAHIREVAKIIAAI